MTNKDNRRFGGVRIIIILLLAFAVLTSVTGCQPVPELDRRIDAAAAPYRFDLVGWEAGAVFLEFLKVFEADREVDTYKDVAEVTEYFANVDRIRSLERQAGSSDELDELRHRNQELAGRVEKVIEAQIREVLAEQGIYNPADSYLRIELGFPPVNFHLGQPPHVLVVSPRDRIESLRKVTLLPELTLSEMEAIEAGIDNEDYSSLVVGIGGIATYPSYVIDTASLRFVIDTAVEEWLHQYLAFTPLGFSYMLDLTGIRPDYEVAVINETVAGIFRREIGAIVYERYYAAENGDGNGGGATNGFDFNAAMRETRLNVDDLLSRGEIEAAESYMESRRQYIAENGYYIRKLNQAYFAFHGAYADSPTSVDPIGVELRSLRSTSESLKGFLDTVAGITSRQDLANAVR